MPGYKNKAHARQARQSKPNPPPTDLQTKAMKSKKQYGKRRHCTHTHKTKSQIGHTKTRQAKLEREIIKPRRLYHRLASRRRHNKPQQTKPPQTPRSTKKIPYGAFTLHQAQPTQSAGLRTTAHFAISDHERIPVFNVDHDLLERRSKIIRIACDKFAHPLNPLRLDVPMCG